MGDKETILRELLKKVGGAIGLANHITKLSAQMSEELSTQKHSENFNISEQIEELNEDIVNALSNIRNALKGSGETGRSSEAQTDVKFDSRWDLQIEDELVNLYLAKGTVNSNQQTIISLNPYKEEIEAIKLKEEERLAKLEDLAEEQRVAEQLSMEDLQQIELPEGAQEEGFITITEAGGLQETEVISQQVEDSEEQQQEAAPVSAEQQQGEVTEEPQQVAAPGVSSAEVEAEEEEQGTEVVITLEEEDPEDEEEAGQSHSGPRFVEYHPPTSESGGQVFQFVEVGDGNRYVEVSRDVPQPAHTIRIEHRPNMAGKFRKRGFHDNPNHKRRKLEKEQQKLQTQGDVMKESQMYRKSSGLTQTCDQCNRTFLSAKLLLNHYKEHSVNNKKCKYCGAMCSEKDYYPHMKKVHGTII